MNSNENPPLIYLNIAKKYGDIHSQYNDKISSHILFVRAIAAAISVNYTKIKKGKAYVKLGG
ncbi:hypothetical protein ACTAZI_03095 [Legionella bozemanae]|uniref:hypothetical protein n=1 Tax=Legionella bozemanae TaxID=447 RepID=UPI00399C5769